MGIRQLLVGTLFVVSTLNCYANETRKFTVAQGGRNDLLGFATAISGDVAFAGAPDGTTSPGKGYLFEVDSGNLTATLAPSVQRNDDLFGFNSRMVGSTLVVGDPGNPFARAKVGGAGYFFDVNSGTELMRVQPNDSFPGDEFGFGIGFDGQNAIFGAPNLGTGPGSAYLFDSSGNQLHKLTPSDPLNGSEFGADVAVDGRFAVVGAPGNFDTLGFVTGHAYVFDTSTGQQLRKLTPSGSSPGDEFGFDVAISGNIAVIGAPEGGSAKGKAYLFNVATGQEIAKLTPSVSLVGDDFGAAVDIFGDSVIVGSSGLNDVLGSAYVFDAKTGQELDRLTPSDLAATDTFGASVAISNKRVLIGSPRDDVPTLNSGAAYLFELSQRAILGDFNNNGVLDTDDIDALTDAVIAGNHPPGFDVNNDGLVNTNDRTFWVEGLAKTFFGDANLSGEFDSSDLIKVLQGGQYEDNIVGNSRWMTGDWDGDLDFTTSDLIIALQRGNYEGGPRAAAVVPEPTATTVLSGALLLILSWRRKRG